VLFRLGAWCAPEAELGDVMEEYAARRRTVFWLARQIASIARRPRNHLTIDEGRSDMLSNISSDIRYALRTYRRAPGFALAAVAPIALGIGINTGLFSILNSLALRPLSTPESTELVSVYQEFRGVRERRVHGARSMFSVPEYRAYRDGARTLSGVMAYSRPRTVTLGGQPPQEVESALVTCNYFEVLQLRPAIGAGFTSANCEAPNAPPAVMLSHELWIRAFGGDPGILHKTIVVNGQNAAVVGVAPEAFDGIDITKVALFVPTRLQGVLNPQ
jgi:putative ABC transport system permease protein